MWNARELWKRFTSTRNTRALEREAERARAENLRLRAENRALLNSILGIAGLQPIPVEAPEAECESSSVPADARAQSQPQIRRRTEKLRKVAPMRRRSWHQVHRRLELQSARKKADET